MYIWWQLQLYLLSLGLFAVYNLYNSSCQHFFRSLLAPVFNSPSDNSPFIRSYLHCVQAFFFFFDTYSILDWPRRRTRLLWRTTQNATILGKSQMANSGGHWQALPLQCTRQWVCARLSLSSIGECLLLLLLQYIDTCNRINLISKNSVISSKVVN